MKLCINIRFVRATVLALALAGFSAQALDLDWSGQFRTENHWVHQYAMDGATGGQTVDAARAAGGGYYVPGGGSKDARWTNLFLRLRPRVIVNDNISIKSEWWVGDPVYGVFGDSLPYQNEQRYFNTTFSRGSAITAQRLWGEFVSDVGTFQVGRMPLHWGLGIVWNSGDGIYDRYASTGDAIRLVSKFGSFTVAPAIIKYSQGNNLGGNYSPTTDSTVVGVSQVSDYSFLFKYENPDEEIETGVNFVKRIVGAAQDPSSGIKGYGGVTTPAGTAPTVGANFNTWDIYGAKRYGKFHLGVEVPIESGNIGGTLYRTYAFASDVKWNLSDAWDLNLKAGLAPGQGGVSSGSTNTDTYRNFYFHPNYKLGLIMFNYQLRGFHGPNTLNEEGTKASKLSSPYDNPITNAEYLNLTGQFKTEKWRFHTTWTWAKALESATAGSFFFNSWDRRYASTTAVKDQSKSLGWEMDYGFEFHWDENFVFNYDLGWYFPGSYYRFSNTAIDNDTSSVFAMVFKAGVNF